MWVLIDNVEISLKWSNFSPPATHKGLKDELDKMLSDCGPISICRTPQPVWPSSWIWRREWHLRSKTWPTCSHILPTLQSGLLVPASWTVPLYRLNLSQLSGTTLSPLCIDCAWCNLIAHFYLLWEYDFDADGGGVIASINTLVHHLHQEHYARLSVRKWIAHIRWTIALFYP